MEIARMIMGIVGILILVVVVFALIAWVLDARKKENLSLLFWVCATVLFFICIILCGVTNFLEKPEPENPPKDARLLFPEEVGKLKEIYNTSEGVARMKYYLSNGELKDVGIVFELLSSSENGRGKNYLRIKIRDTAVGGQGQGSGSELFDLITMFAFGMGILFLYLRGISTKWGKGGKRALSISKVMTIIIIVFLLVVMSLEWEEKHPSVRILFPEEVGKLKEIYNTSEGVARMKYYLSNGELKDVGIVFELLSSENGHKFQVQVQVKPTSAPATHPTEGRNLETL